MIIYKITNLVNGKVYIGQTIHTLEKRFNAHKNSANKGYGGKLYPAMRKYGIENFKAEIIEECNSIDELNEREIYWIDFYDSTNKGYNILIGGDINMMFSPLAKQHHKEKLSSKETRQNISNGMKKYRQEHPFTDEHRRKISESMKGNCNIKNPDTRSIECYCITNSGVRYDFHNYKDAAIWWYNNYKPFGEKYVHITLQRKISSSIKGMPITYNNRGNKIIINNIKWYKK